MSGCHQKMSEAAVAVNGVLYGEDHEFVGVSTDTRTVSSGQLFVALKGPNYDAHNFVQDALKKGAAGVLVQRKLKIDAPQIIVPDTQLALGRLAAAWRQQFSIPVIAITGSNGKTTVKEMIVSILKQQGSVLSTRGNLNNEIGVPLTLLQFLASHDSAIIEEGASHPGDISYLSELVKPTVAVVTNAAGAHLEGFGSLDAVARTKGELFENLPEGGTAVINADDKYASLWKSLAGDKKIITFGLSAAADVRGLLGEGALKKAESLKGCRLEITTPEGECSVLIPLMGRHNAINALAATAAALSAGVKLDVIKKGLESVKPVPGRLEWKVGVNNARILDDTYNANPASFSVALDVLSAYPGDRYLALGDMAELGEKSEGFHEQAGRQARDSGVSHLYAIGEYSRFAVEAFGEQAWHFSAQEQLVDRLREDMNANVTLLVKGSRSSRMDKVVEALVMPHAIGGAS
jgi:UDP-N-acetylmuramoyl-tripeptide--D-alanyl-D-alanine ligase